ncbi:S-layer homology domain-containing protein [Acetivibrio mesophilus]|uniref:SLH domain-containing protein n=1 Tax=Acetivibrio mesophilus TaxID=2487273 RepID=A0A4V1K1S2_9FIRM|nr:S-layer homology domain-containing protein [Acetivibrio mesophilus]RXE57779.1 hypothetical protein EFD62_15775 [Acetivibrio mesophilus]HHV30090.1 hypothetical protein [Clostridium sp.]
MRAKMKFISYVLIIVMLMSSFSYASTGFEAGISQNQKKSAFADIEGHWCRNFIEKFLSKNWVKGYDDGKFYPDKYITRAEFTAMVVNIFKKQEKVEDISFSDVNKDDWFYNVVSYAAAEKLVTGYEDGTFKPMNNMSRQDAAVLVTKLFDVNFFEGSTEVKFADEDIFPEYSSKSIKNLASHDIVKGYPDKTFKPFNLITRAEAVRILDVVLLYVEPVEEIPQVPAVSASPTVTATIMPTVTPTPNNSKDKGGSTVKDKPLSTPTPNITSMPTNVVTPTSTPTDSNPMLVTATLQETVEYGDKAILSVSVTEEVYKLDVTLDDIPIVLDENYKYEFNATVLGKHVFDIKASDNAGKSQSISKKITVVDTKKPEIDVSFEKEKYFEGDDVVITVKATDNVEISKLSVQLNGKDISLDQHGRYIIEDAEIQEIEIVVTAWDTSNNSSQKEYRTSVNMITVGRKYKDKADFDEGVMKDLTYDEVNGQIILKEKDDYVVDNYVYTSMVFTIDSIFIFGYYNNTECMILNSKGDILWQGVVNYGEHIVKYVNDGSFEVRGTKPFAVLTGDPFNYPNIGFYARDQHGKGLSNEIFTCVAANGSNNQFIIFAYEDDTEVTAKNSDTKQTIWSGTLQKGKSKSISGLGGMYIQVNATKPVSALTCYDEAYYAPSSDGNWIGTEFYTYCGAHYWPYDLTIMSYSGDASVEIKDSDTGELIWSGTVKKGTGHVILSSEVHNKYIYVTSDKPVAVCLQTWETHKTSHYEATYVVDSSGTGIGTEFISSSQDYGYVCVIGYNNNTKVNLYNAQTGEFVKEYTVNKREYINVNPGSGLWRITSDKEVAIYSGYGNIANGSFAPVRVGIPQEGTWSTVFDSGRNGTRWGNISWKSEIYNDGTVDVYVSSSENNVIFTEPVRVTNGEKFSIDSGRYIKIEARLKRSSDGLSPVLKELTIGSKGYEVDKFINQAPKVEVEDIDSVLKNALVHPKVKAIDDSEQLTFKWSCENNSENVSFKDESVFNPKVTFKEVGVYTLSLTVSDGELSSEAKITVNVTEPVFTKATSKIVVNCDEWAISDTGYVKGDGRKFAENIINYFIKEGSGKFLAYTSDKAYENSFINQVKAMGHTIEKRTDIELTLDVLKEYDVVFLAAPQIPDNDLLIQYVLEGGNVYLSGATGNSNEFKGWNTFLNRFGLNYQEYYNGVHDVLDISGTHELLEGVQKLYFYNGQTIEKLSGPQYKKGAHIIFNYNNMGFLAVYDEDYVPNNELVTATLQETVEYGDKATLSVSVTEDVFKLDVTLDNVSISLDENNKYEYSATVLGEHVFDIKAYDNDGRTQSILKKITVVDTKNPEIDVSFDKEEYYEGDDVVITVTATDNVEVSKLNVQLNGKDITLDEHGRYIIKDAKVQQIKIVVAAWDTSNNSLQKEYHTAVGVVTVGKKYKEKVDFDEGVMKDLTYDEVNGQLTLREKDDYVVDNYVYTSMVYTIQDIIIFGYYDNTELMILNSKGDIIWQGVVNYGERIANKVEDGLFEVRGTKPFAVLTGDPFSYPNIGFYAMDQNGRGLSTEFFTCVAAAGGGDFVILAYEDDTEVTVRNSDTKQVIWSGTLQKGKGKSISGLGSIYIQVSASKPVSALTCYDETYYVPSSDGNWSGTEFYTYCRPHELEYDLNLMSFSYDAFVEIIDSETEDLIWSGTIEKGTAHVEVVSAKHGKYLKISSSKPITVSLHSWQDGRNRWDATYVADSKGTGLGTDFITASTNLGYVYVIGYNDNTKVNLYNVQTGEFAKEYTVNKREYININQGSGLWRITSDKEVAIYSGYGDIANGSFAPVRVGIPQEGTWSTVFDSGRNGTRWGNISWKSEIYNDGTVEVYVSSSEDNVIFTEPVRVTNGENFSIDNGRYIKIEAKLKRSSDGLSPVLKELTIGSKGYEVDKFINQAPKVEIETIDLVLKNTLVYPKVKATDDSEQLTFKWSCENNSENVKFSNESVVNPKVLFKEIGVYTLMLSVSDGELSSVVRTIVNVRELDEENPTVRIDTDKDTIEIAEELLIKIYAEDNIEVKEVKLKVNGKDVVLSKDNTYILRSDKVGQVILEAYVEDAAGNFALATKTITVVEIDKTPPELVVGDLPASIYLGETLEIKATATDNKGEAKITVKINGIEIPITEGISKYTPTETGICEVVVRATDLAGNWVENTYKISVVEKVEVDEIPPELVVEDLPASIYLEESLEIRATATDNKGEATIAVKINGVEIPMTEGIAKYTPTETGICEVVVTATDLAGNWVKKTYKVSVIKKEEATPDVRDFIRPVVDVSVIPQVLKVGEAVTISVFTSDNNEVVSRTLTINGEEIDLDEKGNATYVSDNAGVFEVVAKAYDAEGNEGCDTDSATYIAYGDTTPPNVSFGAPVENSKLYMPAEIIGTAYDENLMIYKLEYSLKGENQFIEFARGTSSVNDDVLGILDPTMMRNGLYDIRLSATDNSGNISYTTYTYQIDGNAKVGNFSLSFDDMVVPVSGIPITVTRTYDSRNKEKGDFGIGWTLSMKDVKLSESSEPFKNWDERVSGVGFPKYYLVETKPHIVTITYPNGKTDEFETVLNPNVRSLLSFIDSGIPVLVSYKPKKGTYSKLEALSDNQCYVFDEGDGEIALYSQSSLLQYNPDRYKLTTQDGTVYIINQYTGLESIIDINGNTVTFNKDGVIHSLGKSIAFDRDSEGRISAIIDPMGNKVKYEYDYYGDLISVTNQEGHITRFAYNSNHGLVDIIDPRGVRVNRNEYDDNGRLIAHVDADGNRIVYKHDMGSKQEVVTDRLGNVTAIYYDDFGNILAKTDALGNTTSYTYDERGNMLTKTDALGNKVVYEYYDDNVKSITDPLGNKTEYTYNSFGQVLTEKDALGHIIRKNYDSKGNLVEVIDKKGNIYKYSYDDKGNILTETDRGGKVVTYTYNDFGYVESETDQYGNKTIYNYDLNGNPQNRTITYKYEETTETYKDTLVYNAVNRVTKIIDLDLNQIDIEYDKSGLESRISGPVGTSVEREYDVFGNLIKEKYSDGTEQSYTYDKEGRRKSIVDCSGLTTYFEYDKVGRLTKTIYPDNTYTQTVYTATGQVWKTIDERGNVTEYIYDAAGRNTAVKDALGNITYYEYDALGNMTKVADANGNYISYVYDANGMVEKVVYPDNTFIAYTYNKNGMKTSETNAEGKITLFDYDSNNRLTKVTDALGNITEYTYDSSGDLIVQKDANGNETNFEYDCMGRLIKRTLPMGMFETFTYDYLGNVLSHTSFKGETTKFEYKDGKLVKKIYPDQSFESYTYNKSDQVETVRDKRGITSYEYDLRGRIKVQKNPDGTTLSYTYDEAGNKTSVSGPSSTVTYEYDQLNRLKSVKSPDGKVTEYTYDPVGNRKSVTYPNKNITIYEYDSLNRLTNIVNKDSDGIVISSFEYTLSPVGNCLEVVENTGRIVEYRYDDTYKLLGEKITLPDGTISEVSYKYDGVGNRIEKNDNGIITKYGYDNNNRMITEGEKTYKYDANGNVVSVSDPVGMSISYSYDYNDRLQAIDGTENVLYEYSVEGIRVSKTVNGQKIYYVVDENCDYAQVLEEWDAEGNLIVSYIYGDDLISQNRKGIISYYIYDGRNSVRILTDSTGKVTDTYTYNAFGELLQNTGITTNEFLYAGQQFDPNAGFYYLRARYMDPSIGRFTSMDAYGGNIYDPVSLHKYIYANANPIMYYDPTGFSAISPNGKGDMTKQEIGYLAEGLIQFRYIMSYPVDFFCGCVFFGKWFGKWTNADKDIKGYRYKPDILNTLRREFNEIKPLSPSGVRDGLIQINKYIIAFKGYKTNDKWEPGIILTPLGEMTCYNIYGVIFYSFRNKEDDEEGVAKVKEKYESRVIKTDLYQTVLQLYKYVLQSQLQDISIMHADMRVVMGLAVMKRSPN